MGENAFSGSLPPSLTSLNDVEYLAFSSNFLTGSLPEQLGNLSLMVDLHIDYNMLTGSLSSDLSRWTRLKVLGVNINYFSGRLSPSFSQWNLLEEAFLEINMFSGSIPPAYGQWSQLELLNTVNNMLTGRIPPQLGNLSSVETLDLSNNLLVGSIPAELAQLSNLKYLYLQTNHLTGTLEPDLARIPHLEVLDVASNALVGSIPAILSNLSTHLVYLNLASNFFTGTLPSSLGTLNLLNNVYLNNNAFSGTLSDWIGNWTHLYLLQLDHNRFSSTIPTSIGKLKLLQTLTFENNILTGQLPPSIHTCKGLVEFYANDNLLTGSIPSAVAVPMLKLLALASNLLTGTIPLAFDAKGSPRPTPEKEAAPFEQPMPTLVQRVTTLVVLGGFLLVVDILPVFLVNVAYVYSTTLRLSLAQLYSVATAVSFLKLAWNTLMNRVLLTSTTMRRWFPTQHAQSSLFYALLYAGLCNLILSPLITEALVSPNCFQYVFATIPTNTYSISGGTCYLITYNHVGAMGTSSEYTLACMTHLVTWSLVESMPTYEHWLRLLRNWMRDYMRSYRAPCMKLHVSWRNMGAIRALWTFAVVGTMPAWLGFLLRVGRSFSVWRASHGPVKASVDRNEAHSDADHDDEEIGSPSLVEMTKSSFTVQPSPLHSQHQYDNRSIAE
eukprot:gene15282-10928_t